MSTNFANSYIITSRNSPSATSYSSIIPLPAGQLWWYSAQNQPGESYDAEATDYGTPATQASSIPPSSFSAAIQADLTTAAANAANGVPQITILIHGLGNLFSTSINELAICGSGLQTCGTPYPGLLVSFDWPSYNMFDSVVYYSSSTYGFPAPAVAGTVRGNISCTVPAFGSLTAWLQSLTSVFPKLQVNFICHSEGNYMMMLGMFAQQGATSFVNQVILAAADINNGAMLGAQSGSPADTGQGYEIATLSQQVTVYYSAGDDILPWSEGLPSDHNPSYPGRLGLEGPASFVESDSGVIGVDCGAVINDSVYPSFYPGGNSHSSYFYIPQILQDWSQTLSLTTPANVVNRVSNSGLYDGFVMTYVGPAGSKLTQRRVARAT